MKTIKLISVILFLAIVQLSFAKNLSVIYSYSVFNSPKDGPFVETYISVNANSLIYKINEEGKFQGFFEVIIIFRNNEKIVNYDKYEVKTPPFSDTNNLYFDIFEQQRYLLSNNVYNVEITIADKNSNKEPLTVNQKIEVNIPENEISVSSIQMIESYKPTTKPNLKSKNGYDFIPAISHFYPESKNDLTFYAEIYGANKDPKVEDAFLIKAYIKTYETDKILDKFVKIKRVDAKEIVPFFYLFDITKLPTGNFMLVIEAIDKKNQILTTQKSFFQRSNPNATYDIEEFMAINISQTFTEKITDVNELTEYISSLLPISSDMERVFAKTIIMEADIKRMQQFFYHFWKERNKAKPEQAWINYYKLVMIANSKYATQSLKSYETERGNVFLNYGKPNIIVGSSIEPHNYPYEIWHYYNVKSQSNIKFVFYSADITANDYELLHSNFSGEIYNAHWRSVIRSRKISNYSNTETFDEDSYKIQNMNPSNTGWGDKLDEHYNNPH